MNYTIRKLSAKADIDPIEQLQAEIWGYANSPGSPLPYPARCLFEFAESGGLVAGAFSHEAEMIGFSAGWLGRERHENRILYLHSQLVGVKETWRDSGIGISLKLHQREFALEEQLQLIKWTFDPLQSRNAYLNIRKLGGIVRVFRPDYLGQLGGKMNQAFPTDRFWVEWHVGSSRVARRLAGQFSHLSSNQFPLVNLVEGSAEERHCVSVRLDRQEARLLVEVPPNISQLRTDNPALAGEWQTACRQIFSTYLTHYIIADCFREESRVFYLLVKATPFQVLDDSF